MQSESFEVLDEVLVGTNQWRFGGTRYKVNMTIVNEWYGYPAKHSNDIALIRVSEPFEFNAKVQPIEYSREAVPVHTKLTLTGWGKLSLDEVKQIFHITAKIFASNNFLYKSWEQRELF